ncbi:hypothetical protein KHT87_22450, partial [Alkalihalobacillus clausii]|uniref:hypothetical protein n=1 Tax=Shouchella clausii TaxID=79880 RepID=UPI001C0B75B1
VAEVSNILDVIGPIVERGFDAEAAPARGRPDLREQPDFWDEIDLDAPFPDALGDPDLFRQPEADASERPDDPPEQADDRARIIALL